MFGKEKKKKTTTRLFISPKNPITWFLLRHCRYSTQYPILGLLGDDYQGSTSSPIGEDKTVVIEQTRDVIWRVRIRMRRGGYCSIRNMLRVCVLRPHHITVISLNMFKIFKKLIYGLSMVPFFTFHAWVWNVSPLGILSRSTCQTWPSEIASFKWTGASWWPKSATAGNLTHTLLLSQQEWGNNNVEFTRPVHSIDSVGRL